MTCIVGLVMCAMWTETSCVRSHVPVTNCIDRAVATCFVCAGLPSFPGHKRAATQQDGFGAIMSFTVRGGEATAKALCASLHLITHATSVGGVESLLERRAHYHSDASRGTPPNLLRLSVGLEYIEDIWADLTQALMACLEHASSESAA